MPTYKKAGDCGKTSTLSRAIGKDSLIIDALGNFDELNCAIGAAAAFSEDKATRNTLEHLQNDIHTVCAEIAGCTEKTPQIKDEHINEIEDAIARIEMRTGKQTSFILPGGSKSAALIHLSRAVARRAERSLVKMSKKHETRKELLAYSNRLSNLLHALARLQNTIAGKEEKSPVYRHQQ